MMFFLHLLGFVYGLFAFLWVKITNSGSDISLPETLKFFPKLYPESLFPAGDIGTETPLTAKPYLISGALVLYCGRYLLTHSRRG